MFQTSDAVNHTSLDAAKKHAENRYGDALLSMSKQILLITKYTTMSEFIDSNLDSFCALKQLKNDVLMDENDDEDD